MRSIGQSVNLSQHSCYQNDNIELGKKLEMMMHRSCQLGDLCKNKLVLILNRGVWDPHRALARGFTAIPRRQGVQTLPASTELGGLAGGWRFVVIQDSKWDYDSRDFMQRLARGVERHGVELHEWDRWTAVHAGEDILCLLAHWKRLNISQEFAHKLLDLAEELLRWEHVKP
jgi:hypothetical protein